GNGGSRTRPSHLRRISEPGHFSMGHAMCRVDDIAAVDLPSLAGRLGIAAGHRVLLLSPPPDYHRRLAPLPPGAQINVGAQGGYDVVQVFVRSRAEIDAQLGIALAALKAGGMLWFAYPGSATGLGTELSRSRGWDGLALRGLRPVAELELDGAWSALQFRPAAPSG
ncbi:MAG: hypothetical protein ACREE7_14160, partial [Dongiaceae bacterium]